MLEIYNKNANNDSDTLRPLADLFVWQLELDILIFMKYLILKLIKCSDIYSDICSDIYDRESIISNLIFESTCYEERIITLKELINTSSATMV